MKQPSITLCEPVTSDPRAASSGNAHREADLPAEFSDDALALRFTAEHGSDLRYTAAWGRWSEWDGSRWKRDASLYVFDLARAVCRAASFQLRETANRVTNCKRRHRGCCRALGAR